MSEAPLRLLFDVQGEVREAARECEADVFSTRFGNTAQDLADAYGKYESTTHFMAVTDQPGRVVGAARLIFPGPAGLKSFDDVAGEPWRVDLRQAAAEAGLDLTGPWTAPPSPSGTACDGRVSRSRTPCCTGCSRGWRRTECRPSWR